MARRADHTREELKKLILEAAWKIAGKEGFEALTARRIATEIGYAPGTIYNIFQSMEDLYLQINGRTLDILYAALSDKKCNDPSKPLLRNLKTMASAYMNFASQYRPYWLPLFSGSSPEEHHESTWYREKINLLFTPLEEQLRPLFTAKQERKRKIAARVLWASVHGLCFLNETKKIPLLGGQAEAEEMTSYLIETFIAGIEKE